MKKTRSSWVHLIPWVLFVGLLFILLSVIVFSLIVISEKDRINEELSEDLHSAEREISLLSQTLQERNAELSATRASLQSTLEELESTNADLEETERELEDTQSELSTALRSVAETRTEILELENDILDMEDSIESSIQWFKDNSDLPAPSSFTGSTRLMFSDFLDAVEYYCVIEDGYDLYVSLGCISEVMEDELSFNYISEFPDKLYSIEDMVYKNGGDCEDYSLFLKATLNYLEEKYAYDYLIVEAWEHEPGSRYILYETPGGEYDYYYYPDATAVELGYLDELYPYIICYTTTYDSFTYEGHCIVALSYSEIGDISELDYLDWADAFEPQSGRYMGVIGEDFHICEDGEDDCHKTVGSITIVIGDDDLYNFNDGEWESYETYSELAYIIKTQLDNLLAALPTN